VQIFLEVGKIFTLLAVFDPIPLEQVAGILKNTSLNLASLNQSKILDDDIVL